MDRGWGTPLVSTGRFKAEQLRQLQAIGVTTIEDLLAATAAAPEPMSMLIDEANVASLQADLAQSVPSAFLSEMSSALEGAIALGALPPADVDVPSTAISSVVQQTLASLVAPPEEAPSSPDDSQRVDFVSCMQPIRNQGQRGTCVAHAAVAVLECLEQRRLSDGLDLSEQYLYWCCKENDGSPNAPGTYIRVATAHTVSNGVPLEADWPYNPLQVPGNEAQGPVPAAAAAGASSHQAAATVPVPRRSSADVRRFVSEGIPVCISIPVFAKWINPSGKIPMPIPTAPLLGGHAMTVVGSQIDLTAPGGGFFIVRNSWGVEWASASPFQAGYGFLPYDYIDAYGWESETIHL